MLLLIISIISIFYLKKNQTSAVSSNESKIFEWFMSKYFLTNVFRKLDTELKSGLLGRSSMHVADKR